MLRNIIENTKANPTNNGVGFYILRVKEFYPQLLGIFNFIYVNLQN
jgi:hypothetical protein